MTNMELHSEDIKVMGEWDGELIWREKTPEEKCVDQLVKMGVDRKIATETVQYYGPTINQRN